MAENRGTPNHAFPVETSALIREWRRALTSSSSQNLGYDPNYYATNPESLLSSSAAESFTIGTGNDVIQSIAPHLESADHEVIFITCFWASSTSLKQISESLRRLSAKALQRGDGSKIRVRIGLSSLSILQKLFQTARLEGRVYPPSAWSKKLHLPSPAELRGLDLEIKSIFVRPFSVMHPKFIIVDRRRVWLPSCNVSWEPWFEGCIELSGPIVGQFVRFWESFWARNEGPPKTLAPSTATTPNPSSTASDLPLIDRSRYTSFSPTFTHHPLSFPSEIPTLFLPSPHHRNPSFRPFSSLPPQPPPSPLNTFLQHLFATATTSIYIQTPNLTAAPVLSALLHALARGVNVSILTSAGVQVLEQLVTAGTTTSLCVARLVRRYKRLLKQHFAAARSSTNSSSEVVDIEAALSPTRQPGKLEMSYFSPRRLAGGLVAEGEPVQSHLKLTIVDGSWVLLGSGNMDRASWYTSQELGVAFYSAEMAGSLQEVVRKGLEGRRRFFYGTEA